MEREGLMEEDIWEIGGGRRNEVFIDKLRKRILFFGIAFRVWDCNWKLDVERGLMDEEIRQVRRLGGG